MCWGPTAASCTRAPPTLREVLEDADRWAATHPQEYQAELNQILDRWIAQHSHALVREEGTDARDPVCTAASSAQDLAPANLNFEC